MDSLKFYTISPVYIDYLAPHALHLFRNKQEGQQNDRKYIGIIFRIGEMDYFAPLSSFKEKHKRMADRTDFIKIKRLAVINLNCMFPVPVGHYFPVDFSKERNKVYRDILVSEYRFVKSIQDKIRRDAAFLYRLKTSGDTSAIASRCNDFLKLEELCQHYNV